MASVSFCHIHTSRSLFKGKPHRNPRTLEPSKPQNSRTPEPRLKTCQQSQPRQPEWNSNLHCPPRKTLFLEVYSFFFTTFPMTF